MIDGWKNSITESVYRVISNDSVLDPLISREARKIKKSKKGEREKVIALSQMIESLIDGIVEDFADEAWVDVDGNLIVMTLIENAQQEISFDEISETYLAR